MANIAKLLGKSLGDVSDFDRVVASISRALTQLEGQFQQSAQRLENAGQPLLTAVAGPLQDIGLAAGRSAGDVEAMETRFCSALGDQSTSIALWVEQQAEATAILEAGTKAAEGHQSVMEQVNIILHAVAGALSDVVREAESLATRAAQMAEAINTFMQASAEILLAGQQIGQLVAIGLKWAWMGAQALFNAGRMALAWFIALGPVGWVIAAVIGLAILIFNYWEEIRDCTLRIWFAVTQWLSECWDNLKKWVVETWDGIRDWIAERWDAIAKKTSEVWEGVLSWLSERWDRLKEWIAETWDTIKDWIAERWEAIATKTSKIWEGILSWLSERWDRLKEWIAETWDAIKDWIAERWEAIATKTSEIWEGIVSWLSDKWHGIINMAANVWGLIRDTVANLVAGARDRIVETWQNLATRLGQIWDGIKSTARRIWDGIVDAVKKPINWVIRSVNQFLDSLSRIRIEVPRVNIPLVGEVGGFSVGMPNIPRIPLLATGGNVAGAGAAWVAEKGPELIDLPRGARVTPLSSGGDDVADTIAKAVYSSIRDAFQVERAQDGGGDREVVMQVDGQRFARMILPALIREGQRTGIPVIRLREG